MLTNASGSASAVPWSRRQYVRTAAMGMSTLGKYEPGAAKLHLALKAGYLEPVFPARPLSESYDERFRFAPRVS